MTKSQYTKCNNLIIVSIDWDLRHAVLFPSILFVLSPQQKVFQTSLRDLDLQRLLVTTWAALTV